MKIVKILDLEIDKSLLNLTKVAEKAGFSQPYVHQLLDPENERKRPDALRKVRNAIVNLYGSAVTILEEATAQC